MKELTMAELRKCLIAKLIDKKDALTVLSVVSGVPKGRIDNFISSGEIALGDFVILKNLA